MTKSLAFANFAKSTSLRVHCPRQYVLSRVRSLEYSQHFIINPLRQFFASKLPRKWRTKSLPIWPRASTPLPRLANHCRSHSTRLSDWQWHCLWPEGFWRLYCRLSPPQRALWSELVESGQSWPSFSGSLWRRVFFTVFCLVKIQNY